MAESGHFTQYQKDSRQQGSLPDALPSRGNFVVRANAPATPATAANSTASTRRCDPRIPGPADSRRPPLPLGVLDQLLQLVEFADADLAACEEVADGVRKTSFKEPLDQVRPDASMDVLRSHAGLVQECPPLAVRDEARAPPSFAAWWRRWCRRGRVPASAPRGRCRRKRRAFPEDLQDAQLQVAEPVMGG